MSDEHRKKSAGKLARVHNFVEFIVGVDNIIPCSGSSYDHFSTVKYDTS